MFKVKVISDTVDVIDCNVVQCLNNGNVVYSIQGYTHIPFDDYFSSVVIKNLKNETVLKLLNCRVVLDMYESCSIVSVS